MVVKLHRKGKAAIEMNEANERVARFRCWQITQVPYNVPLRVFSSHHAKRIMVSLTSRGRASVLPRGCLVAGWSPVAHAAGWPAQKRRIHQHCVRVVSRICWDRSPGSRADDNERTVESTAAPSSMRSRNHGHLRSSLRVKHCVSTIKKQNRIAYDADLI